MKLRFFLTFFLFSLSCSKTPVTLEPKQLGIPSFRRPDCFVLLIEPFRVKKEIRVESAGNSSTINVDNLLKTDERFEARDYLYLQAISIFNETGDFSLVDNRLARRNGKIHIPMEQNERGPYLLRLVVTEFNPISSYENNKVNAGFFLRYIPIVQMAVEFYELAGLPTNFSSTSRESVIAFDATIIDLRTNVTLSSFPIRTTFKKTENVASNYSKTKLTEIGKSSPSEAIRLALIEARSRVLSELEKL